MTIQKFLKNIIKSRTFNLFAWLIVIDIGIFIFLLPVMTAPPHIGDDDVLVALFWVFGQAYIIIKLLLLVISFIIEKVSLKPPDKNSISDNLFYTSFEIISVLYQLAILIPLTAFFICAYLF